MKAMCKMWTVLLVLAAVLLVTTPAAAQNVATTPSAPVVLPSWAVWVVAAVIAAVLAFAAWVEQTKNQQVRAVMTTLDEAIRGLTDSIPASVRSSGQAVVADAVDAGFDAVRDRVTARTPRPEDDELLNELERRLDAKLAALGLIGPDEETTPIDVEDTTFGQLGSYPDYNADPDAGKDGG